MVFYFLQNSFAEKAFTFLSDRFVNVIDPWKLFTCHLFLFQKNRLEF